MSNIEVTINGKSYKINSSDEEAALLKKSLEKLEERVAQFREDNPTLFMSLNQETLFLSEILSLISETEELKQKNRDLMVEVSEFNEVVNRLSNTIEDLKKIV